MLGCRPEGSHSLFPPCPSPAWSTCDRQQLIGVLAELTIGTTKIVEQISVARVVALNLLRRTFSVPLLRLCHLPPASEVRLPAREMGADAIVLHPKYQRCHSLCALEVSKRKIQKKVPGHAEQREERVIDFRDEIV